MDFWFANLIQGDEIKNAFVTTMAKEKTFDVQQEKTSVLRQGAEGRIFFLSSSRPPPPPPRPPLGWHIWFLNEGGHFESIARRQAALRKSGMWKNRLAKIEDYSSRQTGWKCCITTDPGGILGFPRHWQRQEIISRSPILPRNFEACIFYLRSTSRPHAEGCDFSAVTTTAEK